MPKRLLFAAILPLAALWAPSLASAQAASGGIGYPSPAAALAALKAKPGVVIREDIDWTIINDTADATFWSITTGAHPAHPTAVKRRVVDRNGELTMEMSVMCGGPKEACDRVVAQFNDITGDIADQLKP